MNKTENIFNLSHVMPHEEEFMIRHRMKWKIAKTRLRGRRILSDLLVSIQSNRRQSLIANVTSTIRQ